MNFRIVEVHEGHFRFRVGSDAYWNPGGSTREAAETAARAEIARRQAQAAHKPQAASKPPEKETMPTRSIDPFERMFAELSPEQRKRFPTVESLRAEARRREANGAHASDPESDELDRIFGIGKHASSSKLGTSYDPRTGVQTFGVAK